MNRKLAKHISLATSRQRFPSHIVSFLSASQQAILPIAHLSDDAPQDLVSGLLAYGYIFSVRALETFLRDTFISVASRDQTFLREASAASPVRLEAAILSKVVAGEIRLAEAIASELNFQNLKVVDSLFRPLLKASLLQTLSTRTFNVILPGCTPTHGSFTVPTQRISDLEELFATRHELVHNSNFPLPIDQAKAKKLIGNANLVGQLIGILIADAIKIGHVTTEVPLWQLIYVTSQSGKASKLSPDRIREIVESNPTTTGKTGQMGNALILGDDLL